MKKRIPLKFQVFIFAVISGFVPLIITMVILQNYFVTFFEGRIEQQAMDIALQVADNIHIKRSFSKLLPDKETLQQISNDLRERTGAHVVFLDMMGSVLIQPYPSNLQLQIVGKEKGRALKGETYVTKTSGDYGKAIRAFVPIINDNQQVGIVVVAFLELDIQQILSKFYNSVYTSIPIALVIIVVLSIFLASDIKRRLFGMEPSEIATKLIEREGILQSVSDGIIATDENFIIKVSNLSAQKMITNQDSLIGKNILDIFPDIDIQSVISTKRSSYNRQLLVDGKIILVNVFPVLIKKTAVGTVLTLKNLTEINDLAQEITGNKKIVEALRAKTHEFSNILHVITGLIQNGLYDEVEKYISKISKKSTFMSMILDNIHVMSIKGLLLGKSSEAEEKRLSFSIDQESFLLSLPKYFDENSMVIVLGNLIDNAFDALSSTLNPQVYVSIIQDENNIKIIVRDNGPGIPFENQSFIFMQGYTTKTNGRGYGLFNVYNRVTAANGDISLKTSNKGTTFLIIIPYDYLSDRGGE